MQSRSWILDNIHEFSLMSLTFTKGTSAIRKDTNIKPAVLKDTSLQYQDHEGRDMDNPVVIEELVRGIGQLDKEGHEEVYLAIRRFKPQTFFASNSVDTRFNIYGLNAKERNEVHRIIQMCKSNLERKHVLEDATNTHESTISNLTSKLLDDEKILDTESEDPGNPSEVEKIREMLLMNNTK